MPDRTEEAFKRMRDRQPKVVLQRTGPASWLSFSHCFCERRRARGRIINAIFPLTLTLALSPSLSTHRDPVRPWTMAIECTNQNGIPPLPLSTLVNYASRRCRRNGKKERERWREKGRRKTCRLLRRDSFPSLIVLSRLCSRKPLD